MHPLVREAAEARLRSKPGLVKDAQRWLVEQMAQLGRRLRQEPAHSKTATRERLVAEGPNVQRLCAALQRGVTANAGSGVLDWQAGTQDLASALSDCGLCLDAKTLRCEVRSALASPVPGAVDECCMSHGVFPCPAPCSRLTRTCSTHRRRRGRSDGSRRDSNARWAPTTQTY